MPLVVPDTVQVTVRGTTGGRTFANVYAVQTSETIGPNGQALAVLDAYISEILPFLTDTVHVVDAAYVDLSSVDGNTGTVTPSSPGDADGGITAPACPPNVTYLARFGGVSERGVRNGRSYLPGVREDEVDGSGHIGSIWLAGVQGAVTDFISAVLAGADAPLVTIHNPSTGPTSSTEILGTLVSDTVATQRRRLRS